MEPQAYSVRRHWGQIWNGWKGRRFRWLCTYRLPFATLLAIWMLPGMVLAERVEHATPLQTPQPVWSAPADAQTTAAPRPDVFVHLERRRVQRPRKVQRELLAVQLPDVDGPGTDRPNIRIGRMYRHGKLVFGVAGHVVYSGFRSIAAQTYYETARPAYGTPLRTFYIDSATGDDARSVAQAQNSATPWQTTFKAEWSSLGGGRQGTAGDRFYIKGTHTITIRPPRESSGAYIVYEVWPGFTANIVTAGTDGCYYAQKAPYVWLEGLNIDASADTGYGISTNPADSIQSDHFVLMDCTIDGTTVVQANADGWIEGNTIDSGQRGIGIAYGPQSRITAALLTEVGNVDAAVHSYIMQGVFTSPSGYGTAGEYTSFASTTDQMFISIEVTTDASHGKVQLTLPALPTGTTARRIYRKSGAHGLSLDGSGMFSGNMSSALTTGQWKLVTTVANNNNNEVYVDNIADGSLGAAAAYVTGNAGDGMIILDDITYGGTSDRMVVYANNFGNAGHTALSWGCRAEGRVHADMRIAFNTSTNTLSGGIGGAHTTDLIIECNDIADTCEMLQFEQRFVGTANGLVVQGIRTIARYNRITNGWGQAILVQGNTFGGITQPCYDCQVVFNVAHDNLGSGMQMVVRFANDVRDNLIANNIFWNNCLNGMTSQWEGQGYYNGAVFDMWINLVNISGTPQDDWFPSNVTTLNGNRWVRNIFSTTPDTLVMVRPFINGATIDYTLAEAEAAFGADFADNECADPQFTSTTPGNPAYLALDADSPAIDTGSALSGYGYSGSAPDKGVYEREA